MSGQGVTMVNRNDVNHKLANKRLESYIHNRLQTGENGSEAGEKHRMRTTKF